MNKEKKIEEWDTYIKNWKKHLPELVEDWVIRGTDCDGEPDEEGIKEVMANIEGFIINILKQEREKIIKEIKEGKKRFV